MVEQKFTPEQKWHAESPPLIVSALQTEAARGILATGYPQKIDLGVGHGAGDFEYGELRFLSEGAANESR